MSDEPEVVEAETEAAEASENLTGVLVLVDYTDKGVTVRGIEQLGDVRVTEILTILEKAIPIHRNTLGL